MSININGRVRIYKDDKGRYSLNLMSKELSETGEEIPVFMQKKVTFRKGVEIKNKSLIEIKDGWISVYRVPQEPDEEGKAKYKHFDKIFVSDFEVLEEGTDEVKTSYETKKENKAKKQEDDFSFRDNDFDLPF